MRKLSRRSWLWGPLLLAVVIGAGYLVVPAGVARIGQKACEQIQLGWTKSQVEELLGSTEFRIPHVVTVMGAHVEVRNFSSIMQWEDEDGNLIMVIVDGNRGVIDKGFTASKLSLLQRVKHRVSRRIRALWP